MTAFRLARPRLVLAAAPLVLAAAPLVLAAAPLALAAAPALAAPEQYVIDPDHASIAFAIEHTGFFDVEGLFRLQEGSFTYDPETQALSDVRVVIAADSVYTADEERDEHVRNADFLHVEEFPEIVFEADGGTASSETAGTVDGELTILGETRPVTLVVTLNHAGTSPIYNDHRLGVSAVTTVLRSDYGMTYALENNLVGDEVAIDIGFEAVRQ